MYVRMSLRTYVHSDTVINCGGTQPLTRPLDDIWCPLHSRVEGKGLCMCPSEYIYLCTSCRYPHMRHPEWSSDDIVSSERSIKNFIKIHQDICTILDIISSKNETRCSKINRSGGSTVSPWKPRLFMGKGRYQLHPKNSCDAESCI